MSTREVLAGMRERSATARVRAAEDEADLARRPTRLMSQSQHDRRLLARDNVRLVLALEAVERLVRFDECHHTVVDADGYEGPCDQTAFALRVDPDGGPYPVCIEHAAKGPLFALGQIRDLIETELGAR